VGEGRGYVGLEGPGSGGTGGDCVKGHAQVGEKRGDVGLKGPGSGGAGGDCDRACSGGRCGMGGWWQGWAMGLAGDQVEGWRQRSSTGSGQG
jgi:hypothetical protein